MRKILLLACVSLVVSACGNPEYEAPEKNVIKEYVNVPKDKARGVGSKLESAQDAAKGQIDSLQDDE